MPKSKLNVAQPPVSCPLCKKQCELVSFTNERFVLRHSTTIDASKPCNNQGKLWSIPQKTIIADEL